MLSFTFIHASLWRRALAAIVDLGILGLLAAILLQPFIDFLGFREVAQSGQHPFGVVILRAYGLWFITMMVIAWLYFSIQESSRAQATFGKRLFGIRVFTNDESRVSFLQASERFWAKLLSAVILGAGFLMALSNSERRALHDLLSHTQVLQDTTEPIAGSRVTA